MLIQRLKIEKGPELLMALSITDQRLGRRASSLPKEGKRRVDVALS